MDIRKYFQDYMLVIFLISIHHGFCSFEDDYEDLPAFKQCPRIRSKLKNGRVKLRYKGRIAKFTCNAGYDLAGKRSSTCLRGQWSNPTPVCVARGCNRVPSISNGRVTEMYRGALLMYDCNPGYTLKGDISIHCDGRQWNESPPVCTVNPDVLPETKCSFESPFLCGWTHDPTHDFDWRRNQFATPSGHVGTGPSYDHTFGKNKAGYYMFIEASSPRKTNDTARLFSPVYPAHESGGCFTFWYHMYGATTGGLRVYFKPESHVFGELSPKWEKFGDQGNQWLRGNISVPFVMENFQIVIEGIRGESYIGDSAIDDVQLSPSDCLAMESENETTSEATAANSCRGRCRTEDPLTEESCECKESCVTAGSCCSDYHALCYDGNETFELNTNEPDPGDYYGKTTSPLTVIATSSLASTTEMHSSSASVNVSPQFASQSHLTSLSSSVPVSTSTIKVTSEDFTSSPSPSASYLSTESTKISSTGLSVKTEPQPVTVLSSVSTSTASHVVEASTPKPSTTSTTTTSSTNNKAETSALTYSVKPSSSTKTTFMTSSTSTFKTSDITPKPSQATTSMYTPSTTTTTTSFPPTTTITKLSTTTTTERSTTTSTERSTTTTTQLPTTSTTQRSTTTTTQRSTTTTPVPTTQSSTTTIPMSTTRSSTTTRPVSTIQSSTTTTPISTTVTSISTSTPSTTMSSTTFKPVLFPFTSQSTSISTSVSTASATPSVTQSSSVLYTTTPRYNLRPRNRTSISTSTTTRSSPIPSRTTASSFISSRTPSGRWFDLKVSSTSMATGTRTSTTKVPLMRSTYAEYSTRTSKYPYRTPKSTITVSPFSTTSDSYEMVLSKTESSKSSGSSSVVIGVVVFAIICIVGGSVFYIRRYRRKRLSKLDDDSEMRFLPDSDYMEYSDSSALDRILAK